MLCTGHDQANQRGAGPGGAREVAGRLQPGRSRCERDGILPLLRLGNL